METSKAFLEYYTGIRKRTLRLLNVIKEEHLDFTYKEGKFTVGDQLRHIGAIERFMFMETLQNQKSKYSGCSKDLAENREDIVNFLDKTHRETLQIIANLGDEEYNQNCISPTGAEIQRKKWLMLLAEHEIHHRAELYIYVNLLGVKTPPMFQLTSEELIEISTEKRPVSKG